MRTFLTGTLEWLDKLLRWYIIVLMAILVALTFIQVVARYAMSSPFTGTDQLARIASVWLTFIGAAVAVWKNKNVWIGAGILLLTLVMAAAIWEVRSPEGAWLRSGVDRVGRAASDLAARGAAAARTGLAAAGRRIGFIGPGVVTGGRAAAPTAAGTPAASAPAVGGRVIAPAPGGGSPRPIRPAEPASQPQAPRGRVPVPVETPPPADAGVPQAAAPPSAPAEPVPASVVPAAVAVYSASDPLVVPPERIRPRAPGGPPEGTRAEDLAEVEIVVSATGEVESVRLVSPGVGPRSAMMLSAVKAWRFSPATRAGQPVPYKLRMRLPAG